MSRIISHFLYYFNFTILSCFSLSFNYITIYRSFFLFFDGQYGTILLGGDSMNDTIQTFRDGIFALRTRRFGKVAELMIQKLGNFSNPTDNSYDLYDAQKGQKIEVKFSTVMRKNAKEITEENVIDQITQANLNIRILSSAEAVNNVFNCNIQQVKPYAFDILYYGTFFQDTIYIFRIPSSEIKESPIGFSDKQHRGNLGEGQFHITNESLAYHLKHYFVTKLTYEELYQILSYTKKD